MAINPRTHSPPLLGAPALGERTADLGGELHALPLCHLDPFEEVGIGDRSGTQIELRRDLLRKNLALVLLAGGIVGGFDGGLGWCLLVTVSLGGGRELGEQFVHSLRLHGLSALIDRLCQYVVRSTSGAGVTNLVTST